MQGRVGVDHAGRDVGAIGLESFFESFQRPVHRALLHVNFGGAAPDHDQAFDAILLLEALDVRHQLFGQIHLGFALLHIGAVQVLHPFLLEHGRHGTDASQETLHLVEQLGRQHSSLHPSLVRIIGENVPSPKDHVFQARQRDQVFNLGNPFVGPLAKANRAHLRQRTDRQRESLADGLDSGDQGRRHSSHPWDQYSQFAFRFGNLKYFFGGHVFMSSCLFMWAT